MIGHCTTKPCPFAHDYELVTDQKCVECFLYEVSGFEIANQIMQMSIKKKEIVGEYATKVHMRRKHFLKVLHDCTGVTIFDKDGTPHYMIAGCEIEVNDDMQDRVFLYVE